MKSHADKSCYYDNTCKSELVTFSNAASANDGQKQAFEFYPSDGLIEVKIPLKVYDKDGQKVDYNENTIRSLSYYEYNGQRFYLDQVLLKDGVLTITAPKPVRTSVGLKIHLEDSANHYLPASEYHVIPVEAGKKSG